MLKEAKTFAKPGDKSLYDIHVLLSQVYQDRNSMPEMVAELEAAKSVAGSEGPRRSRSSSRWGARTPCSTRPGRPRRSRC